MAAAGAHEPRTPTAVLRVAVFVTLGFALVEAAGALWTGSLALLSDAGHMVADSAGLLLAWFAARVAARDPTPRFSYGFGRAEVVGAVANALLLLGMVGWIVFEAVGRLDSPPAVRGWTTAGVALMGAAVNVGVAVWLSKGQPTLNVRAARMHVLGDLLGSVAAFGSGVVIAVTDWRPIDPILSLFIAVLIVLSAVRVLREGGRILLEGVPGHLSLEEIGRTMASVEGVASVHDLHVWQLASHQVALSAHVVLRDPSAWVTVLERVRARLHERFGIGHVTLQPARGASVVLLEPPAKGVPDDRA